MGWPYYFSPKAAMNGLLILFPHILFLLLMEVQLYSMHTLKIPIFGSKIVKILHTLDILKKQTTGKILQV